jgi:hypothetical protein
LASLLFSAASFAAEKSTVTGIQIAADDQVASGALQLPVGVATSLQVRVSRSDWNIPLYDSYYSRTGPMKWRLAAPDGVASIDPQGKLTTLGAGQAEIEVSYLGRKATMTLTVIADPPTTLTISPIYQTLDIGTELQLDIKARFDSLQDWDMKRRVTWSATPEVSIDASGKVRALSAGIAEITATVAGKVASTQVMVLVPAADSPQRAKSLSPRGVYRACRARLRRLWLPKLREIAGVAVELRGNAERRSAGVSIDVAGPGDRGIAIFWNPDACEGPDAGWNGSFDWHNPSTPLDKMLSFAGNDCLSYPFHRAPDP